jgi:serine protease AprX
VVASTAAPPVLTTITVLPASASVQNGGTQQFSATGYDQNHTPMNPQPAFTWSVSGGGSISASGLFTATTVGSNFTVTAASGGVTGTASVSVTDFSLSVSPSSRSIKHGQNTSYSVTITRLNGFAGSIAFTVGGLPSNATASFSPNPTNGTSVTLKVSTSRSSPSGTYTLQITGTSGGHSHVVNVSLTLR